MLIGDVLYYTRNGKRLASMDVGVSEAYALNASKGSKDVVEWRCTNGPRTLRYFSSGREVQASQVEQWRSEETEAKR